MCLTIMYVPLQQYANTHEKYYVRYCTALSKMLRESQDRGEGRTVLTSKGFQKYLKKRFYDL